VTTEVELNGRKHRLTIRAVDGGYRIELNGQPYRANVSSLQPNVLSVLVEGKSHRIVFDPRPGGSAIVLDERRLPYRITDPRSLGSRADVDANDTGARSITASMPGRVIRILVQVGDRIEAQQGLIVVEAMKMQNELKAPRGGTVTRVVAAVGATVQTGELLLVIE